MQFQVHFFMPACIRPIPGRQFCLPRTNLAGQQLVGAHSGQAGRIKSARHSSSDPVLPRRRLRHRLISIAASTSAKMSGGFSRVSQVPDRSSSLSRSTLPTCSMARAFFLSDGPVRLLLRERLLACSISDRLPSFFRRPGHWTLLQAAQDAQVRARA